MTTNTSRNGEKRSEARASRRRRQSYRSLYEHTPVMMHSIDRDGRLMAVNNRWLEVLGYERSEVIGRRSTDFLTPSSRRYAFEVALPAFFEKGEDEGVRLQMVKKDGQVIDVSLSATAELDEAGEVVSSRCFIIDETQHKRIDERLQRATTELAVAEDTSRPAYGTVTVLLADGHELVMRGLRSAPESVRDITVVGEAFDGEEAMHKAQTLAPDIAVLDVQMPKLGVVEVTLRVREPGLGTRVILLTAHDEPEIFFEALRAGARGYLLKETSIGNLERAIWTVHQGGSVLQLSSPEQLAAGLVRGEDPGLTQRQLQVLRSLASGKRYKEIAEELSVSLNTIKSHAENVYERLGARNRTEAIRSARERGILNA